MSHDTHNKNKTNCKNNHKDQTTKTIIKGEMAIIVQR